jgi:signal transduction histidine kinase
VTDAGSVFVAVEDSGIGLDPAISDRWFDPFFTTKPNGMGMGLSISRSIAESHGGSLTALPKSPHGAVFRFTLPSRSRGAP